MFGEFLSIVFKSIKLDKSLYSDNKNFGEAAIYFAGLIMILDGVAGAVAANTVIKTAVGMSGLTAILTWLVWGILIYVVGVKIFPDKQTKVPFKKVLTAVGFAHAPGLIRFFAVTPELMIPIIFLTQFWIFAALIIATRQILNLKSNFKSFGIVFLSFLIIAFLSISFLLIWAAGLFWFKSTIVSKLELIDRQTDAIVVLTGGSERLKEGMSLLVNNMAIRMFISLFLNFSIISFCSLLIFNWQALQ